MDIKELLEELQEIVKFDSMEDATGTNEIVESELEKPANMEKAEYKKTDIKEPEIDTVAKKLLGKIGKLQEDASGYLNDDEIADFYKDFEIVSIDNIEKKESVYNGETNYYYVGEIEIKFPHADEDNYDEFAHETTTDEFIAHNEDGTKVAFDNWYPAEVYEKLANAVTEAIQAKFLPEDEEGNKLEAVTRSDDNKYVIVKNKTTGKYQVNLLDETETDLIGARVTTQEFDSVKDALAYTDQKHESVNKKTNEEFSMDFPLEELPWETQEILREIGDRDEEDNNCLFVTHEDFKDYIDELKADENRDAIDALQDDLGDTFDRLLSGEVQQVKFLQDEEPSMNEAVEGKWVLDMSNFLDTLPGDPDPSHVEFNNTEALIDLLNEHGYELADDCETEQIIEALKDLNILVVEQPLKESCSRIAKITESLMNEISQETAEKVNIKRQQQALLKTAEAEKEAKEADEANEKAVKNDKLITKWKKSKGIKESKVVARYSAGNKIHEIALNKKGLYNIRYNVVEGKAQTVRGGVKSLPVAIDVLKKRFPEAEEIKLNECKLSRKARLQQSVAKVDRVETK